MTRLFFTTDIHASDRCFRKSARAEHADGILRGALVNLADGKVKEFLLTSG